MSNYRRIEVNAYRRVTTVHGELRARDVFDGTPAETDDRVSVSNSDTSDRLEPGSPEGQLMLAEAVRTLEKCLTPETRAMISDGEDTLVLTAQNEIPSFLRRNPLINLFYPKALRFVPKEK